MIITTEVLTRPDINVPFYHEIEHHINSPRKQWKETRGLSAEFIGKSVKLSDDKLSCTITSIWRTSKKQEFSNPKNLEEKLSRRTHISPVFLEMRERAKSRKALYLDENGITSQVTTIKKDITTEQAMVFLSEGKTALNPD